HLRTNLRMTGPVTVLGPPLSDDVEAVLRETVSNAIRHARASTLSVELRVGDEVTVVVSDNGMGISPDIGRRSGLANLTARAEAAGGHCGIEPLPGGGTTVRWQAPLP